MDNSEKAPKSFFEMLAQFVVSALVAVIAAYSMVHFQMSEEVNKAKIEYNQRILSARIDAAKACFEAYSDFYFKAANFGSGLIRDMAAEKMMSSVEGKFNETRSETEKSEFEIMSAARLEAGKNLLAAEGLLNKDVFEHMALAIQHVNNATKRNLSQAAKANLEDAQRNLSKAEQEYRLAVNSFRESFHLEALPEDLSKNSK